MSGRDDAARNVSPARFGFHPAPEKYLLKLAFGFQIDSHRLDSTFR
jgi:hypothetical protein